MTIVLSSETESKLREKADREGVDINTIADALLLEALDAEAREFEEAVKGIQRGLDDCAQGRVRSSEEAFAYLRSKISDPSR